MFCDEPVIRAYMGEREYDDLPDANAFFDCYHGIVFHVTDGYRIVLETEHFYISLSSEGVSLDAKTGSLGEYQKPGEWLEPFVHGTKGSSDAPLWIEYEHTLFCGERLLEVAEENGAFSLVFDDFTMKIFPHKTGDEIHGIMTRNYLHVYGCERLLKKPCACGGVGELFLDFVSDYFVRCANCKKATWAQMIAQDAIDAWNSDHLNWDASEITIE